MNKQTTRSLSLALLMIAAAFLPLLSAQIDPVELQDNRDSKYTPPSPCAGADACRGTDAGGTVSDRMNLTDDFDFTDGPETNSYPGSVYSSVFCYTDPDCMDYYHVNLQPGYGISVTVSWNTSGASLEQYNAFLTLGEGASLSNYYTNSWYYRYYSTTGQIQAGTDGVCQGNYGGGSPGCGSTYDVLGQDVGILITNYYGYYSGWNGDYTMNITVFPADGGVAGDEEVPLMNPLLDLNNQYGWGTYESGEFTLDGTSTALVEITSCDSWCPSETTLDITKPDGTVDSFGYWANGFSGVIANYTDAGEYLVEKMDSYGDAGMGMQVGISIGNFSGLLSGDMFSLEDAVSGHVNQSDTQDVYAVVVPENFYSNITLTWDADADLDIYLYSNADQSGLFDYSWFDNPEYIDNGQTQGGQMFFVVVEYYSGTDSHAGYLLELGLEPGSPPPCWFQDDGYSGDDAGDGDDEATNVDDIGVSTFTGMVCAGYDDVDYFEISVPAYHGLWASLDWGYDNESIDGLLYLYQYMDRGYSSFVSSSTGMWEMQAVATNESYYWNTDLALDSTVWLMVSVADLPDDYEMNYTIVFDIYNATEEPMESIYQNDGMWDDFLDAGDSSTGSDAMEIMTMNQTFQGYGHDKYDMYDYYKIYVPNNYAMEITVDFPEWNDIDLSVLYMHPVYGYMWTIASSYNDNPESVTINYDYGDMDVYVRIMTDRGSGDYEVTIGMLTPGLAPGDIQDDCGTGMDMDAPYFYGGSQDNHWANESTQAGLDPTDPQNHTGGVCTGWVDYAWDWMDTYAIPVPTGSYVTINTTWEEGHYMAVYMLMCQTQHEPCSPTNPMYYAGPNCYTSLGLCESNSGLWPAGQDDVNGNTGWISMWIYTYDSDMNYTMDIQFPPLSELEGGSQNDANSGRDAGPGGFTAVHAPDYMNSSQSAELAANNTLAFEGWTMAGLDDTDRFSFDVPANHGVYIYIDCGYDTPDLWCILDIYDSAWNAIGMSAFFSGYQDFNTTSQASSFEEMMGIGVRNWGGYDDVGTNYNVTITFYSLDADGDGWWDGVELDCGTDPYDNNSTPDDLDGDGICDANDDDIDGDGSPNDVDEMPFDENSSSDQDGDGISDIDDLDIDGDGWENYDERVCLGEMGQPHLNENVTPTDYDGDGLCDMSPNSQVDLDPTYTILDPDGDNDGVDDAIDAFPFDASESVDTDGDRIGNNADMDDDDDGYNDTYEMDCGSEPLDGTSQPQNSDAADEILNNLDPVCDALDDDDDNDGTNDTMDWAPYNPQEWMDSDSDGYGDNADMDDDNDGWWDSCETADWLAASNIQIIWNFGDNVTTPSNCPSQVDAFPNDSTEWVDTDGDGVGDNADLNDDGDAWTDAEEADCGTDSLDPSSVPADSDGDLTCDVVDTDDDNDGIPDTSDSFPFDASEQLDNDNDGVGDELDTDDDNDGWTDLEEAACLTDSMDTFDVPTDSDNDLAELGLNACDLNDEDDDNDHVLDDFDAFPLDPSESVDTDGDGTGDNADTDDDGDGWLDISEVICAASGGQGDPMKASEMPADSDYGPGVDGVFGTEDDVAEGDGICDAVDPDTDGDGFPNPEDPNNILSWEDHFPTDHTEWYDANGDGLGDNGVQPNILDDIEADPAPFIGVLVAIVGLGIGLTRMAGSGSKDEDGLGDDYTDEFEDFDFDDEDENLDDEDGADADEVSDEEEEAED